MEATLRKEILTETYEDMRILIFDIVREFQRRYDGDIDDLMAQANLLYIYAYDKYDETKAKLSTWLTCRINYGLLTYIKAEYKQTHLSINNEHTKIESETPNQFSIMELLDEMEQDALTILQLFLETPKDIIQNIIDEGKQMNHIQGYMRKRIRNRMRQMGWTIRRITESFEEIKNALQY